jgi:protocatechuate 3,4-dioxygenase beta subunit
LLQTDQFPTADFVPTPVDGVPAALPVSGEASFRLLGDLTIKEVTRPVEWQISAQVDGARVTGQAVTSFTFADFELQQPRVPVVLSVEDTINLEVDFTLVTEGRAAQAAPETTQVVALPATGCTPLANPTPPMTEGPYYTPGSPERASLLEEGVVGERLVITGFVLTVECEPVAGALLDFWQTDGQGVYDNSGYRLRGHQFTDESGAYRLETVVPGEYSGRTQHIHVKVQAPGGEVLTTQLFLPGAPSNETDSIFSPELVMQLQETADGAQGTFNFILEN